jgi:TM2 domain-containing membrane protein YozV
VPLEHKNPGIAALLAAILGIWGLMGIGHIYVGKIAKGVVFLIVGIILAGLVWVSFALGFLTLGFGFIFTLIFAVILVILWIYQIVDAYNLAKMFNREVQSTGKPPW